MAASRAMTPASFEPMVLAAKATDPIRRPVYRSRSITNSSPKRFRSRRARARALGLRGMKAPRIHDHLPYSELQFFPELAAFNIGWHDVESVGSTALFLRVAVLRGQGWKTTTASIPMRISSSHHADHPMRPAAPLSPISGSAQCKVLFLPVRQRGRLYKMDGMDIKGDFY